MSEQIYRYAGLGIEGASTYGTAVSATMHRDILSASLDTPDDPLLHYEGGLTRGKRTVRSGFYSPSGNIVLGADIDVLREVFFWALGGGSTTKSWGANDVLLPSFTARIGKDLFEHVFAGCIVNSLELAVDDSYCQLTVDIAAQKDTKATLMDYSSLILGTEVPLAFHELTATAGYTTERVRALTINVDNAADADGGRGVGSRFPYRVPVGARDVTLDATLWNENSDELHRFWGGDGGVDSGFAVEPEFALGFRLTSPTGATLDMDFPRVRYTGADHQPSGRDRMDAEFSGVAMMDTVGGEETEIMVEHGAAAT